ncbi:hypothetical protein QBC38DRAFT_476406 [Podospora fimiseda]|uniref:Mid2 domain-containing protein n=1 Tax=Podospora fimiseda TaxID=252190 RepID=A0AAN7BRA5_9PEZI|nr:hypothetical protein QBC38DRAFT_476406 [Podospora fimiseda]
MRLGLFFLCRVALFGVSVHSLVFPGPQPTTVAVSVEDSWTPKPTTAPAAHELLRRQNTKVSTYLLLPDNVCGFVGGQSYGCGVSSTCAFLPASPGNPGAVGCCNGAAACSVRSGCMPLRQLDKCGEDCDTDPSILKCSLVKAPFCNMVTYPQGTIDYYCDATSTSRMQNAQISKPGQKSRTLTKLVVTATPTPITRVVSTRSNSSGKPSSTTSAQDSNPAINPDTPQDSDPSTISTAPAATSSAAESVAAAPAPASSNTGAIVGGVVGGLAGLGLIILAVLFFLRRKKNNEAESSRTAPTPDGQAPNMSQKPPSAPSPTPSDPFKDPPSQENVSFSQLANAFPKVPEPLNLSRPGTAASVKRPITPSQFSPLSAVTIAATKAAMSDNVKRTTVAYPEPSPMSTPAGSPRSARYQPPDPTSFYPNYPQYRPPSSRSQSVSQSGWPSPTMSQGNTFGGGGGSASPVSTYSVFPVSPVPVRGSSPPEKRQENAIPNFPLILQPGMGVQRLPPGTVRQVTLQRGASRRKRESQALQTQGQEQAKAQSASSQNVNQDQTVSA